MFQPKPCGLYNCLRVNTVTTKIVAVPDKRITFYADRKGLIYDKKVPKQAKYIVRIGKNEDEKPEFGIAVQKGYSVWVNKEAKGGKITIYEVP